MFDLIMHDIIEPARYNDTPTIMLDDFNGRTGEASALVEIDETSDRRNRHRHESI